MWLRRKSYSDIYMHSFSILIGLFQVYTTPFRLINISFRSSSIRTINVFIWRLFNIVEQPFLCSTARQSNSRINGWHHCNAYILWWELPVCWERPHAPSLHFFSQNIGWQAEQTALSIQPNKRGSKREIPSTQACFLAQHVCVWQFSMLWRWSFIQQRRERIRLTLDTLHTSAAGTGGSHYMQEEPAHQGRQTGRQR